MTGDDLSDSLSTLSLPHTPFEEERKTATFKYLKMYMTSYNQ